MTNQRHLPVWVTGTVALVAGIALMVASLILAASSGTAVAQEEAADRTITVTGTGIVTVTANVAHVNVGVESTGDDVSSVFENANQQMEDVLGAIRELGIPDDRIETTHFSIMVERDREGDSSTISGYTVRNSARISATDVEQIPEIIATAVDAGANVVGGVTFSVEDQGSLVEQARELAVEDARMRAEHLAELAEVTLGGPVSIVEDAAPRPAPGDVAEDSGGLTAPPIVPGEGEISVVVTVTYAIE